MWSCNSNKQYFNRNDKWKNDRRGFSFNGDVVKALDGLPPVKLHCSVLAEEAIHEAIADYYRKEGKLSEEEIKIKCNLKEHHCESCCI